MPAQSGQIRRNRQLIEFYGCQSGTPHRRISPHRVSSDFRFQDSGAGEQPVQRAFQRPVVRRPRALASNDHNIPAFPHGRPDRRRLQSSLYLITSDSVPQTPADGKTEASRSGIIGTGYQHQPSINPALANTPGQREVTGLSQTALPLHRSRSGSLLRQDTQFAVNRAEIVVADQTLSLCRPLNILLLRTFRPDLVRIRVLKPCTLARRLFFG